VPSTLSADVQPEPISTTLAEEILTNQYCLFPTIEAAIAGAERFAREQPEPGDYFVVEVLE